MDKLFLAFSDQTVHLDAPGSNSLTLIGAYDALDFAGDSVTAIGDGAPPFAIASSDGSHWSSDLGDGSVYKFLVVLAPSPADRLSVDGDRMELAILHIPASEGFFGLMKAA